MTNRRDHGPRKARSCLGFLGSFVAASARRCVARLTTRSPPVRTRPLRQPPENDQAIGLSAPGAHVAFLERFHDVDRDSCDGSASHCVRWIAYRSARWRHLRSACLPTVERLTPERRLLLQEGRKLIDVVVQQLSAAISPPNSSHWAARPLPTYCGRRVHKPPVGNKPCSTCENRNRTAVAWNNCSFSSRSVPKRKAPRRSRS